MTQENKVSPGQQQWWETKAANFDSVLLFKQGKFYEVGAVQWVVAQLVLVLEVGVAELNLSLTAPVGSCTAHVASAGGLLPEHVFHAGRRAAAGHVHREAREAAAKHVFCAG